MAFYPTRSAGVALCIALATCRHAHDAETSAEPSATAESAEFARRIDEHRRRHRLPALAAAVVRVDGDLSVHASGVRARGHSQPVTVQDRFHLGSCSKAMTATLVGILVDKGVLGWDTTIADALGSRVPELDSSWSSVTIRQLLAHRGGAPATIAKVDRSLWKALVASVASPPEQRQMLVEGVLRRAAENVGTYVYSNAGYAIVGAMLEAVTGEAYEVLIRRELFDPLGLATAGFGAPGVRGTIDEPRGHKRRSAIEPGPGADNPAALAPAGTVHMSISDWAKFVQLHLTCETRATLVQPATCRTLHQVVGDEAFGYALGWEVTDEAGPNAPVLVHTGTNGAWYAMVWAPPQLGFGIVAVTNQGGRRARKAIDAVVWDLAMVEVSRQRNDATPTSGASSVAP